MKARSSQLPVAITPIAVSAEQGAALLGVSERAFHQLRHEPGFPAARDLSPSGGGRAVRWSVIELAAWFAARPPAASRGEPDQLAGRRYRDGRPVAVSGRTARMRGAGEPLSGAGE